MKIGLFSALFPSYPRFLFLCLAQASSPRIASLSPYISNFLDPFHSSNLIAHPPHAEHLTEAAALAFRALPDRGLHVNAVPYPVLPLDLLHVRPVPVIADQPRDEELRAEGVGSGEGEGVVDEQGITDGFVNYAIQDMC